MLEVLHSVKHSSKKQTRDGSRSPGQIVLMHSGARVGSKDRVHERKQPLEWSWY